jgi:hypothetical protein
MAAPPFQFWVDRGVSSAFSGSRQTVDDFMHDPMVSDRISGILSVANKSADFIPPAI